MSTINYFAILLRQKANLLSLVEADRVAGAVPLALAGVLAEKQLCSILDILPGAAMASNQKFYHRLDNHHQLNEFNLAVLLTRLKTILNLTGADEAEQYLRAYFLSARTLMSASDNRRLFNLLPPQLVNIIDA